MSLKLDMVPDHGDKSVKEAIDQGWALVGPIELDYACSLLVRENTLYIHTSTMKRKQKREKKP